MIDNIFENIPENIPEELIQNIFENDKIRIKRIVSKGHSSPKDFWYDQEENEWILLIKGNAALKFEDNSLIEMSKGNYINIPAHTKHRVERTDPQTETIWLAVFY